jgi:hypothetical protein
MFEKKTETPTKHENTYTQREWDRTVGIGVVPPEYKTETPAPKPAPAARLA